MLHMHHHDELITTRDAARRLGVSVRKVSRLVAEGHLAPARTLPYGRRGAFLFDPEDVKRLAAAREEARQA